MLPCCFAYFHAAAPLMMLMLLHSIDFSPPPLTPTL